MAIYGILPNPFPFSLWREHDQAKKSITTNDAPQAAPGWPIPFSSHLATHKPNAFQGCCFDKTKPKRIKVMTTLCIKTAITEIYLYISSKLLLIRYTAGELSWLQWGSCNGNSYNHLNLYNRSTEITFDEIIYLVEPEINSFPKLSKSQLRIPAISSNLIYCDLGGQEKSPPSLPFLLIPQ